MRYRELSKAFRKEKKPSMQVEYFIDSVDVFGDILSSAEDAGVLTDKQVSTASRFLDNLHKKANALQDVCEKYEDLIYTLGLESYFFHNQTLRHLDKNPREFVMARRARRGNRAAFGSMILELDRDLWRQVKIINDLERNKYVSSKEFKAIDKLFKRIYDMTGDLLDTLDTFKGRPAYRTLVGYVEDTPVRKREFDFPFAYD